MSFAGSVQSMITSLKNNARPKRRISDLIKNDNRLSRKYKKELKFRQVTEQELKIIKHQIKEKAYNQRKKYLFILIPLILVLITLLVFFLINIINEEKRETLQKIEQNKNQEQIIFKKYTFWL